MVVFSSDRVNVKGYTGGKGKRLKKVRHHFRRYYRIVSHETPSLGASFDHIQSPTFSRVKGRWHIKYGREEMSITALESDYTSGEQH